MHHVERSTSAHAAPSEAEADRMFRAEVQLNVSMAHERLPESGTWGFFAYDDATPASGGGCGGFLWFNARREMIQFIEVYLPFWSSRPCGSNPCEVAAELRDMLRDLSAPRGNPEQVRELLNRALKGYAQIVWWGQFKELLSAEAGFPRELRGWFRSAQTPNSCDTPITSDERERFTQA